MKRKTMLLAAAALSALAFAALPAVASATIETAPSFDLPANTSFTAAGGTAQMFAEGLPTLDCTSITGAGEFENGTTGTVTVTFHGCTVFGGTLPCSSSELPEKTIRTKKLTFHTVYLKPSNPENPHETPGILFTPGAGGVFATFECFGIHIEVKGGVLGTITNEINASTSTATIDVVAAEEGQQHTEFVTGGAEEEVAYTSYGVEVSAEGGVFVPAYLSLGTVFFSFPEEATLTTE